jgi:DNA-binding CsgD family transcriptional regulator/transcriptional regulator with GAF, ATPase, and Fis domain
MTEEPGYENKNPDPGTITRLSSLSSREREIAMLYAKGQTSKEIADELCISPTTVRNHVATIYRKLEISNKTELVNLMSKVSKANLAPDARSMSGTIAVQESAVSSADRALAAAQAQQRATNDVLRVISHSPGDLEAIFDVILDYALQLSHSQLGIVWVYGDDGYNAAALKNVPAAFQEYLQSETLSPGPKTGLGRMTRQHRIIHIHDVRSEEAYREGDPLRQATADLGGARSFLAIPMIHRDNLIGAFTIYRQEVKPFTDDELTLLQAFSDQAAIALTITRLIDDRTKLLKEIENQTS